MIDGINNLASGPGFGGAATPKPAGPTGTSSFSDMLSKSIDEVSRLQQDASQAVDNITTGKSEDVDGVMTAVEKSDLAFKTLLAIRAKLMDAYEEIKGMPI
jgi:flagellar hook-basal body complex protein FliE